MNFNNDDLFAFYVKYKHPDMLLEKQMSEMVAFALENNLQQDQIFLFEEVMREDGIKQVLDSFIAASEHIPFTYLVIYSYHYIDLDIREYQNYKASIEEVCDVKILCLDEHYKQLEKLKKGGVSFEW